MSYYGGSGWDAPGNNYGPGGGPPPGPGFQRQPQGGYGSGYQGPGGPAGYQGGGYNAGAPPPQPTRSVHIPPIVNQLPQPSQRSTPPLPAPAFQGTATTQVLQRDPNVEKDPEVAALQAQLSASLQRTKEIAEQYNTTVQKYHQEAKRQETEMARLENEISNYNASIKANTEEVAKLRSTSDLGRAIADYEQKIASTTKQITDAKRIGNIFERDIIEEGKGTAPTTAELSRARNDYKTRLDQYNKLDRELKERLLPAQQFKQLVLTEFGSDSQRACLQSIQTQAAKLKNKMGTMRSVATQEPEIMDIE